MLKNAYFGKKNVKVTSALGAPPLNPRWPPAADPRVTTPTYH